MIRHFITIIILSIMMNSSASSQSISVNTFNANNPTASGFSLTFNDDFSDPNTIDRNNTGAAGYNWYLKKFFGYSTEPTSNISVANGVLTISPTFGTGNYNIATAGPANNSNGYVGSVFGAPATAYYIEARIGFDHTLGNAYGSQGFPSFWALAIEHMAKGGTAAQWPGQAAGFEHFLEDDIFEYDTWSFAAYSTFGSARHDWYGKYFETCPGFCRETNSSFAVWNSAPGGDNWRNYHTVGQLWILGTAANNYQGSMTVYVDGNPALPSGSVVRGDPISWTGSPTGNQGSPPPSGNRIYSVVDQQHLNIILGTAPGWPMNVDYVRVWKASGTPTPTAPAISVQPQNTKVAVGQPATFSVTPTGTAPLSYQWQKNGFNISGATGPSYTTPATLSNDSGSSFRVTVSNSVGSITSNSASLTVNSVAASVAAVGYQFGYNSAGGTINSTETAGSVPLANWNSNVAGVGASGSLLSGGVSVIRDATGAPTPISGNYSFPTFFQFGSGRTGDQKLFAGALGLHNSRGQGTINLTGIPYSSYDILVYLEGGWYNGAKLTIAGRTLTAQLESGLSGLNSSFYQLIDATHSLGTYARFNNLSGSEQTITLSSADAYYMAGLTGFQIIPR